MAKITLKQLGYTKYYKKYYKKETISDWTHLLKTNFVCYSMPDTVWEDWGFSGKKKKALLSWISCRF